MENNNQHDYIQRRNQIHRAYKKCNKKPPKTENFFILRLNLALAVAIAVVCAGMIDLDITNTFSAVAERLVTKSSDFDMLKQTAASLVRGDGIVDVFADNTYPPEVDEKQLEDMQNQADAYENTQKKTKQHN